MDEKYFEDAAKELIRKTGLTLDTLSLVKLFLESVYNDGMLDERYGAWGALNQKPEVIIQKAMQLSEQDSSIQQSPYEAATNEFTKVGLLK